MQVLILNSLYGEPGKAYPSPTETFILGLCTGMLSAASVASSKSLPELLEAAVHTVVVAFRAGLVVVDVRNRIEAGNDQVWSMVFPGVPASGAQTAIDRFVEQNVSK
jgi:noranthrone synthase